MGFAIESSSRRLNQMLLSNEFIMQTGARPTEWRKNNNAPSSLFMFVVWCGALYKRGLKIDAAKSTTTNWLGVFFLLALHFSHFALSLLSFYILFLFRMWMVACMREYSLACAFNLWQRIISNTRRRFDKIKTSIAKKRQELFCNRNRCGIHTDELECKTKEMKIPLLAGCTQSWWLIFMPCLW